MARRGNGIRIGTVIGRGVEGFMGTRTETWASVAVGPGVVCHSGSKVLR